jgi:histidinol-phosphate aminotransferase
MDRGKYVRLDLNENTTEAPRHVIDALKGFLEKDCIQMYPDYAEFMPKLAGYTGIDADHLMLTNGSDQAIEIILRAFLGRGDAMVVAQPEFPIFSQVAGVIGARVCGVLFRDDFMFPFQELIDAITTETRLIVIINPNNPTGTAVSLSEIETILKKYPDIPVLVDEAYFEYTGVTVQGHLESHENLIITRTFSKAFAMAGLRLGYIIAHPRIVSEFYKIRGPFDVNSCALVAAEAQIDHPDEWKQYVHETMTVSKPYVERFFDENGVQYYRGAAHYMLVKPKRRDEAVLYLKEHGFLVRPMVAPTIQDTFRMSVGTLDQMKKFADRYGDFMVQHDN